MMRKLALTDIIIIIALVIAIFVGLFTAKNFRQTADKQIEKTSPITYQIFIRGVTITSKEFPIKVSDKTFITIRNVPYTELNVTNVISESRKTFLPGARDAKSIVNDPSQKCVYDAIITVSDVAKITKDGAVAGGNKIKIGLPVVLEGKTYKIGGTISDVNLEES